jgi:hypothetical protein
LTENFLRFGISPCIPINLDDRWVSSQVWQAWPPLEASAVPFGLSGGDVEAGTDHARAASLPKDDGYWLRGDEAAAVTDGDGGGGDDDGGERKSAPDPTCATGISADYHDHGTVVCCPKACKVCGVQSECQLPVKDGKPCPCAARKVRYCLTRINPGAPAARLPAARQTARGVQVGFSDCGDCRKGGAAACCVQGIEHSGRSCKQSGPPCVVHKGPERPKAACLFNLRDDPTERNNLGGDPEHASLLAALIARLCVKNGWLSSLRAAQSTHACMSACLAS